MAYAQLTLAERNYIEMRLKHGDSQNRIARDMNRFQSTISRELAPEHRDARLSPYASEQEGQTTPYRQTQSH
ncbi:MULTISPECIES: helix-turn-helix domain-containing protein [Nitrosomonas]|uniref:Helix-turn-helix protein n=1 Tax=Nitrosomonas communis TaxID=44574 RepID=A0A0F7KF56_9PROT|nr:MULTISPECIES: helix-turn-helix domain-containing protein [Nitrosomonas]AKH37447.1 hypothetical protein AAW31_05855 [Nitrosomonas communis]TYP86388.1 helix-turn-helix protein [Nitrosomonas communis]UVS62678.1 helix-turn-helix domain-containing protein [Nitrosomonas sp. PLL12]